MSTTADVDNAVTYSWSNGRTWRSLDRQSRITFLNGVEEGLMLMRREAELPGSVPLPTLQKQSERLMISGFRFSDIVEQIDAFYADSSNRRIPIVDAYIYALRKMKGESEDTLRQLTASLRQRYNR
ncbi:hypothetical protein [Candidatus Korobacter versatilis]|uniref:hypothetical protein n=1 Tax=Candidatus Korobacter versatilis TaxID=658062 RepID=UPI0011D0ED41|nr:hypothetical protein [Candidatus Koribacter versatilis]